MYCKERDRGACIQCTKGRCYRAYHATCTERRDGTVTKTEADGKVVYETFCNVHDPVSFGAFSIGGKCPSSHARARFHLQKSRALREQEKIQERARIASEMSPGRRVSVRYPDGGEYKGEYIQGGYKHSGNLIWHYIYRCYRKLWTWEAVIQDTVWWWCF